MPSAQVSSYTVHAGRLGALGADRLIVLSHTALTDATATVAAAEVRSEIYFADRFGDHVLGFHTLGSDTSVRAHLPAADYATWLDLLRHEAPVFLHWSRSDVPGTPETDGIIHLATGPEPIGEGPVDFSV